MTDENFKYITIDGDDIGQKISSAYFTNNLLELMRVNELVRSKTKEISDFLVSQGFIVLFCAADGVAGYCKGAAPTDEFIFDSIKSLVSPELEFSVGVGRDLRESYIALLSAKSSGKGCLHNFEKLDHYA